MTTNQDNIIRDLYYTVQRKKAEVESLSNKPNWVTNCAFKYDSTSSEVINIQTVNKIDTLIHIVGWLSYQEEMYNKGIKLLNLPEKPFLFLGYTVDQWITDITTRVDRLSIVDKKKELNELDTRLKKILPPDFERQLELEAIMNSDSLK